MSTLRQFLDSPRPVKKSLLMVSLPWREIMPPKPDNTVLEIFGEMEFRERNLGIASPASTPTSAFSLLIHSPGNSQQIEEIQEVPELDSEKIETCKRETCLRCNSDLGLRVLGAGFPAPISSIGRNGKPWVYYQPIKREGRFVLKEIRIPGQGCMHATRENGRLLLRLSNPNNSNG